MTADVEQLALPIAPIQVPTGAKHMTIQERFDAFHELNPWVLDHLERMAQLYLERGHDRIGIKMLVEVLRWRYGLGNTTRGSRFRLDNDLSSRYVRKIIERHPEWEDAFELRTLKAE